jgi:hypothetical protein
MSFGTITTTILTRPPLPLNASNAPHRVPGTSNDHNYRRRRQMGTDDKWGSRHGCLELLVCFFFFNYFIVTNDYLQIYYEQPPLPTTTYDDDGAANRHNKDEHRVSRDGAKRWLLDGNFFRFFIYKLTNNSFLKDYAYITTTNLPTTTTTTDEDEDECGLEMHLHLEPMYM